ncbi:cytochrome b [Vulcaniibacterium tengchongense]|uniref:Cytochrome b561 n=1 Tax=Vulcaniibacterium tengchongense TaxID=1273429 RepID=A0A3N4VH28_9GAMM|nr:cytochrome b [Vulcaniibacterium tengchongense]RPE80983.1 cytochrome b561 [Vulcaniibacterium tengchongense]
MMLKNTPERWGAVSQLLHWLSVVLILGLGVLGLVMVELPRSPRWFWVYDLHKSLGLSVLALAALRLAWRAYAGAPRPVPGTPRWQARAASATHALLYLLVFAVPLSGWAYDSVSGLRPLRWFGLFKVPKLAAPSQELQPLVRDAHEWLFWILIALVAVHAAAAFYHHLFQRDATLARMLPGRGAASPSSTPAAEIR